MFLLSRVPHAPDAIAVVVGDEQGSVFRDSDAGRPAPRDDLPAIRAIIDQKAREKILDRSRFSVLERNVDDFVSVRLRSIPRTVQCEECAVAIVLRELAPRIELHSQCSGVRRKQHIGNNRRLHQVRELSDMNRIVMLADIAERPAVEATFLH